MLIKNLRLNFIQEKEGKLFFQTENGLEFIFPSILLENYTDRQQPIYIGVDNQPIVGAAENQKEILNELLDHQG